MKKIFFLFGLVFILVSVNFVYAHGEETFAQAEEIIEQKISCENLTEEQLEILGDYYMEQMHPGEAHERMDAMMGGEGSDSLKQVHINMGVKFYCREDEMMGSGGMMGMMNVMGGQSGMMSNTYYRTGITGFNIFGWIIYILVIIILILVILWLTKQLQKSKTRRRN